MAEREFKLDTRFSDSSQTQLRTAAIVLAAAGLAIIALTMTTGIASHLLPMEDRYLQALIPLAPDGAAPLTLQTLEYNDDNDILSVTGNVANRTDFTISNLQAVVEIRDRFGLVSETVTIPVEPRDVPAREKGSFQTGVKLREKLSGFSVKFRLAEGPAVPHKDERAGAVNVNPQ